MEQQRSKSSLPKRLIVCGDSFNIGIGCQDLTTEPYGSLLARHLGIPLINLAKGSSTNLSIWLQVKYAVENLNAGPEDLVLVNETSPNRLCWFPEGYEDDYRPITNLDVNYHDYPPYGNESYHQVLPQHPMQDEPGYRGKMITENVSGVIDYINNFVSMGINQRGRYYNRLTDEPAQKLKIIKEFYGAVYNDKLAQIESAGLMAMSHALLKNKGISHVMLMPNPEQYKDIILSENLLRLSWGDITLKYPDQLPSGHADERGHTEVFDTILAKLKMNGWA
jgi:hypothetical protein